MRRGCGILFVFEFYAVFSGIITCWAFAFSTERNLFMIQQKIWFTLLLLLSFSLAVVSCGSSPNPAAADALKELRKMSGAVEMGLSLQEYTNRMIDMKAEVDEKLSKVPDGEMKQEIKAAQQSYIDAKTLWNSAVTYDNVYPRSEENKAIFMKYTFSKVGESVPKEVALSEVWATANKHIEKATEMNNKK